MNSRGISILLSSVLLLAWAGSGLGGCPPAPGASTAVLNGLPPWPEVSVFTVPNGSGGPGAIALSNCFGPYGPGCLANPGQNAWIDVYLGDAAGPCAGWPQHRIRLNHTGSAMVWCPDSYYPPPPHAPNCADGPTSPVGNTTFSRSYHGGGCIWNSVVEYWDAGTWYPLLPPISVHMNSTDMNGDLVVNLVDVVQFAACYFGGYNYCCDYYWDGCINLSDIVYLAGTIGVSCP